MLLTAPRTSKLLPSHELRQGPNDCKDIKPHRSCSMMRMGSLRQLVIYVLSAAGAIYFLYCVLHGTLDSATMPLPRVLPPAASSPPHSPSADVWEALNIDRSTAGAPAA